MLVSRDAITVDFALQYATRQELLEALTERKVLELSFKGMRELNKHMQSQYSFSLFDEETDLERASFLIEKRNLVTHNRSIVNRRYLQRVPSATEALGKSLRFDPLEILKEIHFLTSAARAIDHRARKKFGIPAADDAVALP